MPGSLTGTLRGLFPGGVVFLLAVGALWSLEDSLLQVVTDRYSLVLYGAGSLLAWVFHRSRIFIGLLGLGLVDLATGRGPAPQDLLVPLGTLLVVLLGLLALLRDRGVLSRAGMIQVGVSAALAWVAVLIFADPARVEAFSRLQLLPTGLLGASEVPQAVLVAGSASLVAAAYGAYRWRGPVERALVWSQVMLLLSMHPSLHVAGSSLLLMATGLTLTISVLETSYVMAYRDELTGLPARRALMHDLDGIGGTYTIAMVDIDHFKKFNDKHGHDVGDQVLQLVASRLAAAPGGGKAYRYGGEEFTLVYPGRVREDALQHLETVRAAVGEARFSLRAWNRPRRKPGEAQSKPRRAKSRSRELAVTVSIGMADSRGKNSTPEAILKKADQALYRAKKDGRNRVSK